MAKRKSLVEFEKGQIVAFHQIGKGYREIGRLINRSDKIVRNYFKNTGNYGKMKAL